MTVTELQIHRGYLEELIKASDIIEGLSYYAAQDERMEKQLDSIKDNLDAIIDTFYKGIRKKEKELLKNEIL